MIYTLINPSDDYTFEADSDAVAAIVAMLCGGGYGVERQDWQFGPHIFGGSMDDFRQRFDADAKAFLDDNRIAVGTAMVSVRIGRRDDYDGLDEKGVDKLMEDRRTSMNNIGEWMIGYGRKLARPAQGE